MPRVAKPPITPVPVPIRHRPTPHPFTPPAYVPGTSIMGGSVHFPGGFVIGASVIPNCPNCGASMSYYALPFTPRWLCPVDNRQFTLVEATPKAATMWRSWYGDFGGGSGIDREQLRRAVHAEMQVVGRR